jgi:serine/threonine protein kinase
MYYAFQDRENLYLVMDYLSGGDLRYHICKNRRFTEEQTSIFSLGLTRFRVFHCMPDGWTGVHPQ